VEGQWRGSDVRRSRGGMHGLWHGSRPMHCLNRAQGFVWPTSGRAVLTADPVYLRSANQASRLKGAKRSVS
jgi:hypothetical protein